VKNSKKLLKMMVLAMLVAIGVVISPILRVEGMCPMAHFINIVCSVLLGPWYSLLCAVTIGIIRMATMGIPPLALTGAVFGAFLSGVFYRMSKGNLLMAVLGEVIGTGIIGAIASYPVMTLLWGKEGLTWLFYVPSFICGTLIGGSIAFAFLKKLSNSGMLAKLQHMLSSQVYVDKTGVVGNTVSIAAIGVIFFVVLNILKSMFNLSSPLWGYASYILLVVFIAASLIYLAVTVLKRKADNG
jgi:energy coupling factor transporter S component ThiW